MRVMAKQNKCAEQDLINVEKALKPEQGHLDF